jgi:hypothetical protein
MSGKRNGTIELTGEVVAADVVARRFELRLSDDRRISIPFTPEHEAAILTALANHLVMRLYIKGIGERSKKGEVTKVSEVKSVELVPEDKPEAPSKNDLMEKIRSIWADVPDSEWEKVPRDGARNLDHYLYGSPKVEE